MTGNHKIADTAEIDHRKEVRWPYEHISI